MIVRLVSYHTINKKMEASDKHTCGICMEEFPEDDVVKHCDGKHIFCLECIQNYKRGNVDIDVQHSCVSFSSIKVTDPIKRFKCPYCRVWIEEGVEKNFTGTKRKYGVNEAKIYEIEYIDGVRNGSFKLYYPSGKVKAEYHYKDGEIHGHCKVWDDSGKIVDKGTYHMGQWCNGHTYVGVVYIPTNLGICSFIIGIFITSYILNNVLTTFLALCAEGRRESSSILAPQ